MNEGPQPIPSELGSTPVSPPGRPRPWRTGLWALGGLLLVAAAIATGYWSLGKPLPPPAPRQTLPTQYRNVRPDVAYVGDARCIECHRNEADHFRQHPMGQSLLPEREYLGHEELGTDVKNPFEGTGLHYQVIKRGNTMWHRETMLDDNNAVVYEKEVEVQYAIGSGTHGRSFLHTLDGQVWQSPISWYAPSARDKKGRWDLSPGYGKKNQHFDRQVPESCLKCHSNFVVGVPETVNQFKEPLFRGFTIGCERCHGPGQIHCDDPGVTNSIVNPVRLDPVLREAVCQQCHLLGEQRINRIGHDISEYRPGLPLNDFISVVVLADSVADPLLVGGQVEQMHRSACYQMSAGKLGCITCHFHPDSKTEVHQLPQTEHKLEYFRQRCLSCHDQSTSCTETLTRRKAKQDSCVACHMPSKSSSNVAHTSITNHQIVKNPVAEAAHHPSISPGELPVYLFHRDQEDSMRSTQDRDQAIGLINVVAQRMPSELRLARLTKLRLETSLTRFPHDLDGRDALAISEWMLGEKDAAFGNLQQVLVQSPRRERTLRLAARYANLLHRFDEELDLRKQLFEVNPKQFEDQFHFAQALYETKQVEQALAMAQRSLQLNPAQPEVRKLIIRCHLDLGQKDLARAALAKYQAFRPEDVDAFKRELNP